MPRRHVTPFLAAALAVALPLAAAAEVPPAAAEAPPAAAESAPAVAEPSPPAAASPAVSEALPPGAPAAEEKPSTAAEGAATTPAAGPARSTRALAVPAAAAGQRIDWYRPARLEEADPNLSWNRSIFGRFDPWTKEKVTFLFQYHALSLSLPAEEGMTEYEGDGEPESIAYPSGRFSATYPGIRVENGNWSLAFAVANGTLRWDEGEETGPAFDMRATTYEAIIARGFGAWAVFDAGRPDFRIGIAWPEIYLRLVYGKFRPELLEGRALEHGIVGAGVSLLGLRATFADVFFAELRAGDVSFNQAVSYVDVGEDEDEDVLLQSRAGFELRPMLRIGFAL